MRMLTDEEREFLEYLAAVAAGAPRQAFKCDADPARDEASNGLALFGRATRSEIAPRYIRHFITGDGQRALRIDALIRQWGYRP